MFKHKKCYNLQQLIVISACFSDIAAIGLGQNSIYSSSKRQLEELESSVIEEEAFSLKVIPINEKCPLSELEHDIAELSSQSYPSYPRLRDIRKYYPGDRFTLVNETWCEDRLARCEKFAARGTCSGENVELEKIMRTYLNETATIEQTGYRFIDVHDPQPAQVDEMMMMCRKSCAKLYKGIEFTSLPALVQEMGGYEDVAIDQFGRELPICDLGEGFIPEATQRAIGILRSSSMQSGMVPALHKVGFEKVKIPKDIYARILNNRKKRLNDGYKFNLETCDYGMQNCVKVLQSERSEECHLVSNENYYIMDLDESLKREVYERLRVLAQEWIENVVELAGTSIYGIRRYTRGAFLMGHLDHLKTHVISAILNIRQRDMEVDWPLQIYDNDGALHEITLRPGEMVWYESARLTHGRVEKLRGASFENIFVHYMPKSKAWFKNQVGYRAAIQVNPVTLESVQKADRELREKKERLREEVEQEERRLESLNFEERTKLLEQMRREVNREQNEKINAMILESGL